MRNREAELVAGGGGYRAAGEQVVGQGTEGQRRSCPTSHADIPRGLGEEPETPGKKGHGFSDAKVTRRAAEPRNSYKRQVSLSSSSLGVYAWNTHFGNTVIGVFVAADVGRNWKSGCDQKP